MQNMEKYVAMRLDLSHTQNRNQVIIQLYLRFFTESCGIDRNAIDKRSMKDF